MDFRYIKPALVAMVIVFCLALEKAKQKSWKIIYWSGNITALAFIAISVIFFQLQLL